MTDLDSAPGMTAQDEGHGLTITTMLRKVYYEDALRHLPSLRPSIERQLAQRQEQVAERVGDPGAAESSSGTAHQR
jgi:hypothetical protein